MNAKFEAWLFNNVGFVHTRADKLLQAFMREVNAQAEAFIRAYLQILKAMTPGLAL